jgi:hypothetical protein
MVIFENNWLGIISKLTDEAPRMSSFQEQWTDHQITDEATTA